MIKITYGTLLSPQFQSALTRLNTQPHPFTTAYVLNQTHKAMHKAMLEAQKEFNTQIVEVFGQRDEAGKLVLEEDHQGNTRWVPKEGVRVEQEKAMADLYKKEMEIDRRPLSYKIFEGKNISGAELGFLEPIFEEVPVIPATENVVALNAPQAPTTSGPGVA